MLAGVIEASGTVVARCPPGAEALAASDGPEPLKIVLDVAGPWPT